jgi:hypothetical protein
MEAEVVNHALGEVRLLTELWEFVREPQELLTVNAVVR